MKATAKPLPPKSEPAPPAPVDDGSVSPELASALRVLDTVGILHPTERRKYSDVLDAEPDVEERKVTFRKAREYAQGT
jgi:hypothetical protein